MSVKKSSVRLKDKRRRASYVSLIVSGALLLGAVGALAYLVRLPAVTISNVSVVGTTSVPVVAVVETVHRALSGSYLLLVPKRLAYVVPSGTLEAAVLAAHPEIRSAAITRTSVTSLTVSVADRTTLALWCGAACYALDEYGFVFKSAPDTAALTVYSGGPELGVGSTFLNGGFHDFERMVRDVAALAGTPVARVRVTALDAFLTLATGGEIRVRLDADQQAILDTLRSLYRSKEFAAGAPLEYIELRFAGKVLAKFKK